MRQSLLGSSEQASKSQNNTELIDEGLIEEKNKKEDLEKVEVFNSWHRITLYILPAKWKAKYLANFIREAIYGNDLALGQLLPTRKDWALALGVDINYVNAACNKLKDEELLVTDKRKNTRVADCIFPDSEEGPFYCKNSRFELLDIQPHVFDKNRMHILKMGLSAVNPHFFAFGKNNPIQKVMINVADYQSDRWQSYASRGERFESAIKKDFKRNRYRHIHAEQMAIFKNRVLLFENVFRLLKVGGKGVIIDSKTEFLIDRLLTDQGACLNYENCNENGYDFGALEALINEKANTAHPIQIIFSNPLRERGGNAKDIFQYRIDLLKKVEKWGMFLIEEFSEDSILELPYELIKANKIHCCKFQISIRMVSVYVEALRDYHVITGPTVIIERLNALMYRTERRCGLAPAITEEVSISSLLRPNHKPIESQLRQWRAEIVEVADGLLKNWFDLKPSDTGTSLWLFAKDPDGVMISMDELDSKGMDVEHSHDHNGKVRVQAIEVCIGYGEMKQINALLKQIQEDLLAHG